MFEDLLQSKNSRHIQEGLLKNKSGKEMLQLRSELPSLFSTISWTDRDSSFPTSGNSKLNLKFIEKENRRLSPSKISRIRNMKSSQQQLPSMYKMAPSYPSNNIYMARTAPTSSVIRTPSSGISSSSSSENMMSALSLSSDEERRIREELMDPSVEVDLEAFMMRSPHDTTLTQQGYHRSMQQLPTSIQSQQPMSVPVNRQKIHHHHHYHNHNQQQMPSQHIYQNQMAMNSARQRDPSSSGHSVPHTPSSMVYVKQQPDWIDYNSLWNTSNSSSTTGVGTSSTSSAYNSQPPQTTNGNRGCNYCWESYVKLCNRVANLDPVFPVDGPWNWHTLYDRQGRVSCPRLWFVQLDRAGAEMVEQLSQKRNAF